MTTSDELERGKTSPFLKIGDAIMAAVAGESGVERPIEPESKLAAEIDECEHDVSRHFLSQLRQHCTMLAVAIADSCFGLARLDQDLPFSAIVQLRGLTEAAADLHWLSDPPIDGTERVRRTFLIYLHQLETQVRQIVEFSRRFPEGLGNERVDFDKAIEEGWESLSLRLNAEAMASAGYELRSSDKIGSKYTLGPPKPSTRELVDTVISDFHGKTGLNLYGAYSSVAHIEGGGLGSLLDLTDTVERRKGSRYRHGFNDETWQQRVVRPGTRVAAKSVGEWIDLAYPSRANEYRAAVSAATENTLRRN